MKVSVDNKLPLNMDQTLRFALTAILRDIARSLNEVIDTVMAKANHSAAITGDTLVKTGQCVYRGFTITVVTAVGSIDIRDGIAAAGGVVIDTIAAGTAVSTRIEKNPGIICETGLYVDYNGGATGTVVVHYE
jgi:flagella basal body P-ring formation protein FlgA